MNESQSKQENSHEVINDNFYETTFKHKFKQGDRVEILNVYLSTYSIIEGFEYSFSSAKGTNIVLYKVKNKKLNTYGWFREDQLKLSERMNNE